MKKRPSKSASAFALVAVIIFTSVFSILGFSLLYLADSEILSSAREMKSKQAFYAAEAGIEYGMAQLNNLLGQHRQAIDADTDVSVDISARYNIACPTMENFTFDVFRIEKVGTIETKVIDSGPYKGMEALIQKYKISCKATSNDSSAVSAGLVQFVEDQRFHLFQFATFYNQDLELQPGPAMTISGRIHSNNDIYLTACNTLSIDSYLTSARDIYRCSKPGDSGTRGGNVQIKDEDEVYRTMDFDSRDPDWASKASERWGEKVKSQVHAIPTISLPIPAGLEPIEIIKRGSSEDPEALKEARFYHQADLCVIDGVGYDKSGNVVDLTYEKDGNSVNPVDMTKSFHNYREAKDARITEIDISKLVESGKFPSNGILYVSSHGAGAGEQDGVRLVNGSELPSGGLTVATDNPLYIYGDYNLNKAPASVLCDALNILSNSWNDEVAWPPANATPTEVNTSVVTGHTPTTFEDGYGGGLENLSRFLESWKGVAFKWRGSINSLWYSEIATGEWCYGWPYYEAPFRDWGFESAFGLSDLPPGTPLVCRTHRSDWTEGLGNDDN